MITYVIIRIQIDDFLTIYHVYGNIYFKEDRPMKKIGVLGTGTMGAGIIQVLAQNGYEVVLKGKDYSSRKR